jgi:type II secretory pathway pseudopilin PulG
MKSQMSLEMIIGLLILLVVAAVVINLFLNNTKGIGAQQYKQALQYRNFKAQCESLCNDYLSSGNVAAAAKFCYTKLTGDTDLNRNGKVDAFQADTKILYICEDAVYCFHVLSCNSDTGKIDWPDCRQILCNAYYDIYQDYGKANEKVRAIFANGIGICTLPSGEPNWFNLYFGSNPCTQGPSGSTQNENSAPSSASVTCSKSSGNSINCNWDCPNAVSTQNTGALSISGVNQVITITTQTGSHTFNNLNQGTKYNIGLICDLPQSQIVASTSVQL